MLMIRCETTRFLFKGSQQKRPQDSSLCVTSIFDNDALCLVYTANALPVMYLLENAAVSMVSCCHPIRHVDSPRDASLWGPSPSTSPGENFRVFEMKPHHMSTVPFSRIRSMRGIRWINCPASSKLTMMNQTLLKKITTAIDCTPRTSVESR